MSKTVTVRKFPKWMKGQRAAVGDAISSIVSSSTAKSSHVSKENKVKNFLSDEPANKRRLRSNYQFPKSEQELKALEPTFNVDDYEFVTYSGRIHYLSDYFEIAEAFDNLIHKVEERQGDDGETVGVAFDMEWTFSFQTGPEKTSLMQVCLDLSECFLFHLPLLKKIPAAMSAFLGHSRVRLHGVNIKNDLRKLERDFPIIKVHKMIENCVDLGVWYNEVFNSSGRWSMERLVLQAMKQRIDKNRQVRMSKWHIFPLSSSQKTYAAIDVYIGQKIYHHILQKQKKDTDNLQEFFTIYGDDVKADENLPKASEISDEIEKLMQQS